MAAYPHVSDLSTMYEHGQHTAAPTSCPNSFLIASTAFFTLEELDTSALMPMALPPFSLISLARPSKFSGFLASNTTGYVAANLRATEAPVPGPTPAMIAMSLDTMVEKF